MKRSFLLWKGIHQSVSVCAMIQLISFHLSDWMITNELSVIWLPCNLSTGRELVLQTYSILVYVRFFLIIDKLTFWFYRSLFVKFINVTLTLRVFFKCDDRIGFLCLKGQHHNIRCIRCHPWKIIYPIFRSKHILLYICRLYV